MGGEYETDEGAHDLYMDQGEEIRFRVVDEVFIDTSPTGPAREGRAESKPKPQRPLQRGGQPAAERGSIHTHSENIRP